MRELKAFRDGRLSHVACKLPSEEDCYTWHLELTTSDDVLAADLSRHAAVHGGPPVVTLAVHFDGAYPTRPPFVRVVSPRFVYRTGHVTVGGSICMQELTTSGWQPVFTMERVLEMIHAALLDPEGRAAVHPTRGNVPYTYTEAVHAFTRVAMQHGW